MSIINRWLAKRGVRRLLRRAARALETSFDSEPPDVLWRDEGGYDHFVVRNPMCPEHGHWRSATDTRCICFDPPTIRFEGKSRGFLTPPKWRTKA